MSKKIGSAIGDVSLVSFLSSKGAAYRVCETAVTIEESNYRAIVVHSDASDKRRQKKLEKKLECLLSESRESSEGILKGGREG